MRLTVRFLRLLAVMVVLFVNHVQAKSQCQFHLDIATTDMPPLTQIGVTKVSGKATKIVKELFDDDSVSYKIIASNWARALKSAEIGSVDAIYPTLKSHERAQYLEYLEPEIGYVNLSLYQLERDNDHLMNQAHYSQQTIATLRSLEFDSSLFPSAQIVEVSDFNQALAMLKKQRVDFVLAVDEFVAPYLRQNNIQDIKMMHSVGKHPVYLALAKNAINYQQLKTCLVNHWE